jgi:hypothetical protein
MDEMDERRMKLIYLHAVDGLVLALTPNNHSYNYRSAILHGFAAPVTALDEKLWAMEQITNAVVADRWAHTRVPPNKTEMTSTQILRVRVVDASAKVRHGTAHDDRGDMKNEELRANTWIGVVPTWMVYGAPIASEENRVTKVCLLFARLLSAAFPFFPFFLLEWVECDGVQGYGKTDEDRFPSILRSTLRRRTRGARRMLLRLPRNENKHLYLGI